MGSRGGQFSRPARSHTLNPTQAPVESQSFAISIPTYTDDDDDTDDTDDSNDNAVLRCLATVRPVPITGLCPWP